MTKEIYQMPEPGIVRSCNWMVWIKWDPRWRLLYDDKRYARLSKKWACQKFTGKFKQLKT